MRLGLGCLVILTMLVAPAAADPRIQKLTRFYEKEANVCAKHEGGIATAKERAQPYVDEDAEIAADVAALRDTHAIVARHCDQIDVMLELLRADSKATYKQLERKLDEQERVIREARKASRQAIEDSDPVIRRLIPKVNARRVARR